MIDERWGRLGGITKLLNLEGVEYREYQANIIGRVFEKENVLVVLPTGLGKTLIAVAVMAKSVSENRKAVFLAPTKPLAEQHYSTLLRYLNMDPSDIALLLGSTSKKNRKEMESKAKIIVATPQTVANDLKDGTMSFDDFGAVVFDECHRAVGKYAYTYVANECAVRGISIVGLTASPGSKKEKIKKLADTLNIRYIEARSSTDPDVVSYVMPKYVHIVEVDLSDRVREISDLLRPEMDSSLTSLNRMGLFFFKNAQNIPKGRLIQLGTEIEKIKSGYKYSAIFNYVKLLNLVHAYDLLVVEGIAPFSRYVESLYAKEKKSKGLDSLLQSVGMIAARRFASEALLNGEEHPKVFAVLDILNKNKGKSTIVFAQYRSTISMLAEFLNNNGFTSMPFVGKKEGVTQAAQKKVIEDFRSRKFDVLVASSIGEEGLDIPSVDTVIFYEAIPNEIRNIQRRGRTGRFREGDVYILVARKTKDEVYLNISRQKERKMISLIGTINRTLAEEARRLPEEGQATL